MKITDERKEVAPSVIGKKVRRWLEKSDRIEESGELEYANIVDETNDRYLVSLQLSGRQEIWNKDECEIVS